MEAKREKLRGGWWKIYNEELHNLQLSQIQGVPGGMDKTSGECSLC